MNDALKRQQQEEAENEARDDVKFQNDSSRTQNDPLLLLEMALTWLVLLVLLLMPCFYVLVGRSKVLDRLEWLLLRVL